MRGLRIDGRAKKVVPGQSFFRLNKIFCVPYKRTIWPTFSVVEKRIHRLLKLQFFVFSNENSQKLSSIFVFKSVQRNFVSRD